MQNTIEKVLQIAANNPEGFTISLEDFQQVTNGVAVAYEATQNSFSRQGLAKCVAHALKNGKKIGGWLDTETNLYYFDSVRIFKSEAEAVAFGKDQKQISVFNIGTKRLIRL